MSLVAASCRWESGCCVLAEVGANPCVDSGPAWPADGRADQLLRTCSRRQRPLVASFFGQVHRSSSSRTVPNSLSITILIAWGRQLMGCAAHHGFGGFLLCPHHIGSPLSDSSDQISTLPPPLHTLAARVQVHVLSGGWTESESPKPRSNMALERGIFAMERGTSYGRRCAAVDACTADLVGDAKFRRWARRRLQ